jgi:hypothetical protein
MTNLLSASAAHPVTQRSNSHTPRLASPQAAAENWSVLRHNDVESGPLAAPWAARRRTDRLLKCMPQSIVPNGERAILVCKETIDGCDSVITRS